MLLLDRQSDYRHTQDGNPNGLLLRSPLLLRAQRLLFSHVCLHVLPVGRGALHLRHKLLVLIGMVRTVLHRGPEPDRDDFRPTYGLHLHVQFDLGG